MTILAEPALQWPEGVLFWTPVKIPFQVDQIARAYLMKNALLVWDTGLGKSIAGLWMAALVMEDHEADRVLVVCEPNKLEEWERDFGRFTRIEGVGIYHGPRRKKLLDDLPRVLITTYETLKADAIIFQTELKLRPGELLERLRGDRLLVIYDEISKLAHRSSRNYKAHYRFLKEMRKASGGQVRVLGLTATPAKTAATENLFNELRLIVPERMPAVTDFNRHCILYLNEYKKPVWNPEGMEWFRELAEPVILRKRKTDEDVRSQFPPFMEKFVRCQMHGDQLELYRRLEGLAWDDDGTYRNVPGLAILLRQVAGHPRAVLAAAAHGESELARMIAGELEEELLKCSSAKAEQLEYYLGMLAAQGHKAIVFTFFGQTVLPVLLQHASQVMKTFTCHGEMTQAARDKSVRAFREHDGPAVLLASDTAARGINIPEADYIIEYEAAFTHHTRTQRAGRGHRILQGNPLTFMTLVLEKTIEQSRTIPKLLERNDQQDRALGDVDAEGFVTGADRRLMFAMAKHRRII